MNLKKELLWSLWVQHVASVCLAENTWRYAECEQLLFDAEDLAAQMGTRGYILHALLCYYAMLYYTIQHYTLLIIPRYDILYSMLCSASTILCSVLLYCTVLCCTVLYCTILYCILYCTLHYITLHCPTLH